MLFGATACSTGAMQGSPSDTTPGSGSGLTISTLVDLCVEFIGDSGDELKVQIDSAAIDAADARAALRPDGLWFVLFPFEAADVADPLQGGCLITQHGERESAWARVAPTTDDFAQWANGALPNEDA